MQGYNEVSPEMLSQAHVLGQPRMRTEAEQIAMMKNALTITVANIAATAYSALAEAGNAPSPSVAVGIAKDILTVSEETKDDYDIVGKRKMRNQLAAQLFFASLRGGLRADQNNAIDSVREAFKEAAEMLQLAEDYANEETNKDVPESTVLDLGGA